MKTKQLPERYAKIWQYMVDSNSPINDGRIEGMLQEIFMSRLGDTKDLVKNNLKTMKVKEQFDLRGDSWMHSVVAKWSQISLPEFIAQVKDIKQTPDIKDRTPKMRQFMRDASAGMSPMNVLSIMDEEYRQGKAELHEPTLDDGSDEGFEEENDSAPGYLRRAGGYAKNLAKAGAGTLGMAMMGERGIIGAMSRGAVAAYGLHKAAKGFMGKKSTSSTTRTGSRLKSLFSASGTGVKAKPSTDFTPREEQLEGGGVMDILKKIEENTSAMLSAFTGKGQGDKKGGMLGGIMDLFGGVGKTLLNFLKGPAMMAAIVALGVALAAAFGKEAADYLCKKFSWLCPNADRTNSEWQNNIIEGTKDFAEKANDFTGITKRTENNRKKQRLQQGAQYHIKPEVADAVQSAADEVGVDKDKLMRFVLKESSGDPNAQPRDKNGKLLSFAKGLGQFTKATGAEFGLKTDADFFDPKKNAVATAKNYKKHEAALRRKLRREPTLEEVYLYHQQGQRGGEEILDVAAGKKKALSPDVLSNMKAQYGHTDPAAHMAEIKKRMEQTENYTWDNSPLFEPSKAHIPKTNITMDAAIADIESKAAVEKDPAKQKQLLNAAKRLRAKNPAPAQTAPSVVNPIEPGAKAPSITPKEVAPSADSSPAIISMNNNKGGNESSGGQASPSHYPKDESFAKLVMEGQKLSFA